MFTLERQIEQAILRDEALKKIKVKDKRPFDEILRDHFADSFVSFITTIQHKKNHIIKITYPDGTHKIFKNGMLTKRSNREISYFTSLFP
jgi:hypothetical protein